MALPEFPQIIDRTSIQQTPHDASGDHTQQDDYGYQSEDPMNRPVKTGRRNTLLADSGPVGDPPPSNRTAVYREEL